MTRETSGCGAKKSNALGTEKKGGRKKERQRKREIIQETKRRELSKVNRNRQMWRNRHCEQEGKRRCFRHVSDCLSALVKMSHINVQINGRLIFQPAPYCHHQMVLLTYLLMTRAEFPPPECQCTANFSWSLLIPCGPFNFALCSSDTANPPTCSHQKGTRCIQNMVQS